MIIVDGVIYKKISNLAITYNVNLVSLTALLFRTKELDVKDCIKIIKISGNKFDHLNLKAMLNYIDNLNMSCMKKYGTLERHLKASSFEELSERYEPLDPNDIRKLSTYSLDRYVKNISKSEIDSLIEHNGKIEYVNYKEYDFNSLYDMAIHYNIDYSYLIAKFIEAQDKQPTLSKSDLINNYVVENYRSIKAVSITELVEQHELSPKIAKRKLEYTSICEIIEECLYYYNNRLYENKATLADIVLETIPDIRSKKLLMSKLHYGDCTEIIDRLKMQVV